MLLRLNVMVIIIVLIAIWSKAHLVVPGSGGHPLRLKHVLDLLRRDGLLILLLGWLLLAMQPIVDNLLLVTLLPLKRSHLHLVLASRCLDLTTPILSLLCQLVIWTVPEHTLFN